MIDIGYLKYKITAVNLLCTRPDCIQGFTATEIRQSHYGQGGAHIDVITSAIGVLLEF